MSSGGAPESWDQDVSNNLSKLNVNATEFVPSWGPPAQVAKQSAVTSTEPSKKSRKLFFNILADTRALIDYRGDFQLKSLVFFHEI